MDSDATGLWGLPMWLDKTLGAVAVAVFLGGLALYVWREGFGGRDRRRRR